MASTLVCNTARVLYNAPVSGTRTSGDSSTSSISRLLLRGRRTNGGSKKLSLKLAGKQGTNRGVSLLRASLNNEDDKVRELASEKAVESGQQVSQDAKKLASGSSPAVLDAKADDASDAASYDSNVRDKVVDVASDMAVDSTADVDALAKKDAELLAATYGRSIEETAEALEAQAAKISDREARKESTESEDNSGSFFQDQVIKEKVLDVASTSAVDEGSEVEATAQKDALDMAGKVGGDVRRNKVVIEGLADTASKLEGDRSGSKVETGATKPLEGKGQNISGQFKGLTRTISKNLKEGIDASRPSLEELSRTASKSVKAGRENLDYVAEGAAEISGDAREAVDGAKGALDKRLKVINLAAEEARVTGSMVAELAAKGWQVLTKTKERFVDNFQKNVGDLQEKTQEKAEEAKLKAEETADQAQSKFNEVRSTVQAKTAELKDTAQEKSEEARQKAEETKDQAQSKFNKVSSNVQAKTAELKDTAQEKATDARQKAEETSDQAKSKLGEAKDNVQAKSGELKKTAQEKASESRSKLEDTADKAQSNVREAKDNVQAKTSEIKGTAQEKASEAKSKIEDTAGDAKSKGNELKDTAQEKASEAKSKLEDTAGDAKSKGNELKDTAQEKAGDAQGKVESKGSSVVGQTPGWESVQYTGPGRGNDQSSGSNLESGLVGQTPTAEVSVKYVDSGKINDEWKGKEN